jgi:uncharacterized protein YggE
MQRMKTRLLLLSLLACAAVAFAGVARPDAASSASPTTARTVTVNGNGAVHVVPNRVSFSFGVTTEAKTARAALAANSAAMNKVIAALRAQGVPNADIQTSSVSLSERMSDDGKTLLGYSASNQVTVTSKNIAASGALVDAAVAAGANNVQGPSLSRSDQDSLYRAALRAAVADARAKALVLAAASGAHLGRVVTIIEGGGATPVPTPTAGFAKDSAAAPTPVQPGTEEIDASVTVVYALA